MAQITNRQITHSFCLLCGGAGFMSLMVIDNQYWLFLSMVGVGIAWASILTLPYSMLIGGLPPKRTGIFMGIFNFFIVLPQIAVSLGFGWVMDNFLDNNRLLAVVIGGVFMVIAAFLTQRVETIPAQDLPKPEVQLSEETAV